MPCSRKGKSIPFYIHHAKYKRNKNPFAGILFKQLIGPGQNRHCRFKVLTNRMNHTFYKSHEKSCLYSFSAYITDCYTKLVIFQGDKIVVIPPGFISRLT